MNMLSPEHHKVFADLVERKVPPDEARQVMIEKGFPESQHSIYEMVHSGQAKYDPSTAQKKPKLGSMIFTFNNGMAVTVEPSGADNQFTDSDYRVVEKLKSMGAAFKRQVFNDNPEFDEEERRLVELIESGKLDPETKKEILSLSRHFPKVFESYQLRRDEVRERLNAIDQKLDNPDEVVNDATSWNTTHPSKISKNDASRLHKLLETLNSSLNTEQRLKVGDWAKQLSDAQVFVVKHDWLGVIGEKMVLESEVKLPYPNCVFEFICNDKPCIVWCQQSESEGNPYAKFTFQTFLNMKDGTWISLGRDSAPFKSATSYLLHQVFAISIVLDAEVAFAQKVEAPAKLNKKRALAGKLPLMAYHVVDLNKRKRSYVVKDHQGGTHASPRLHFRRGHNRTYKASGKTIRIGWQLVGNPDLGFINKHYQL